MKGYIEGAEPDIKTPLLEAGETTTDPTQKLAGSSPGNKVPSWIGKTSNDCVRLPRNDFALLRFMCGGLF